MATISWSSSPSSSETTADPGNENETANNQTIQPSQQQTIQPSQQQTIQPSHQETIQPSHQETIQPSQQISSSVSCHA